MWHMPRCASCRNALHGRVGGDSQPHSKQCLITSPDQPSLPGLQRLKTREGLGMTLGMVNCKIGGVKVLSVYSFHHNLPSCNPGSPT